MESNNIQQLKRERLKFFVQLTERCTDVLTELNSPELRGRYACNASGGLDSYVFTYLSDRTLFLEVTARFAHQDHRCVGTHHFTSHPAFEKVLEKYTRARKKPNPVLEKSRPWDVAVTMVMKVEALLPKHCSYYRRLLKREHAILWHIWQSYLAADSMDFDDMTGIPLVFDYQEIPNQIYFMQPGELAEEIDLRGHLVNRKIITVPAPTLSYMTMEKLGPNLSYLLDLTSATKRPPVGLTVRTAFKIFDQLICRLLQIHRFGVLHNGVCPQNAYFGRGSCYNVVYLNNFRAATLASKETSSKPCINMRLAKDARFASLNMMRSTDMHPVNDIESAFYTLLACIGPGLPWDSLLHSRPIEGGATTFHISDSSSGSTVSTGQSSRAGSKKVALSASVRHVHFLMSAAKSAFWDSSIHMERFIANLMHRLSDREAELFPIIADILLDLYTKVKRLLVSFAISKSAAEFCTQLCRGGNQLLMYSDLRKPALMYFRFEETPPLLNNPADQQRKNNLTKGLPSTFGWNLSEWCFNSVEVRPPLPRA